jgi:hypothetical protein
MAAIERQTLGSLHCSSGGSCKLNDSDSFTEAMDRSKASSLRGEFLKLLPFGNYMAIDLYYIYLGI